MFSSEHAHFSSTSQGWLEHAKIYCEKIAEMLCLTRDRSVIEVASNDGYLLKHFVEMGVRALVSSRLRAPPTRPSGLVYRCYAISLARPPLAYWPQTGTMQICLRQQRLRSCA